MDEFNLEGIWSRRLRVSKKDAHLYDTAKKKGDIPGMLKVL
jgi:hypothetical protein